MLTASLTQALIPTIVGNTIDLMQDANFDQSLILNNIFYIIGITLLVFLATFGWRNLIIGNSRKLECTLREHLFNHFQKLSPEFYNKRKTGDLIAYAINDINAVRMTFGPACALSINSFVICVSAIYFMVANVNLRLTLLCLLPLPVVVVFMLRVGKKIQLRFKKVQENFASISDCVQENIYGIRVVKAYVQEEKEIAKFEKLNNNMEESTLNMVKTSSVLEPVIEICFSISFVLSLLIGGNMVLQNQITLGAFVAFQGYLTMIMKPVLNIGKVITHIQRGMASLIRLKEIFNTEPHINENNHLTTPPINGEIRFENLSFTYPSSKMKALNNISFDIPKGHTIGIVGKTGSGKTTIINLLLKLFNTSEGVIKIDDRSIDHFPLENIRNSIGLVPQDSFLFSTSIKNNITFFKDIYSNKDIEDASQKSYIYKSILGFSDGFYTKLGEQGVNLSGGQKQRIAIARALIKDPDILILDDSLSAVDTETERKILTSLREVRKDKTTIIIAHRISAVEHANEIIVLDEGEIKEKGSHNELLEKGGMYYEMYHEQYSKDDIA